VKKDVSRRDAIGAIAAAAVTGTALTATVSNAAATSDVAYKTTPGSAGRLKQSVSRWCYDRIALPDLCIAARDMGLAAIDLLDEKDWETPKQYGLACAMANGFGTIPRGFNRPDQHDELIAAGARMIPLAAKAGVPNIVCFSGNRAGLSDGEGIANCVAGFRRLTWLAEQHSVTLCLELLNSKVDHKDYQADHTAWGVEVVKGVASTRFKLLYDIYHMQIMEGDVVRTIRQHGAHIAHYHTGGVPGRNEIDDTQELNYRRVMQAIADSGFTGYVAHEFVPKREPLASLKQAYDICNV
jgi:hydroxypyruvate isomerase